MLDNCYRIIGKHCEKLEGAGAISHRVPAASASTPHLAALAPISLHQHASFIGSSPSHAGVTAIEEVKRWLDFDNFCSLDAPKSTKPSCKVAVSKTDLFVVRCSSFYVHNRSFKILQASSLKY